MEPTRLKDFLHFKIFLITGAKHILWFHPIVKLFLGDNS